MRVSQRAQLLAALLLVLMGLVNAGRSVQAQESTTVKYGDTVNGAITDAADSRNQTYMFTGKANDLISVTVKRTSGDLVPVVTLGSLDANGMQQTITANYRSEDDS